MKSIERRIILIKKLVREYYNMGHGVPIFNYTELLRFFDVRGSKNLYHPHKNLRVYISRKSLKHYVESRKLELAKNHNEKEVLDTIYFGIDNLQETVINFSSYEYIPPQGHVYTKDYSNVGKPLLRVIVDLKKKTLEIRSIHFRKNKKKDN